jgi:hypothetical protein
VAQRIYGLALGYEDLNDHEELRRDPMRAEQVVALAEDLKRFPTFQRWVLDIPSPGLLRVLQKNTHQQFGQDVSPLQFAPENGPQVVHRVAA